MRAAGLVVLGSMLAGCGLVSGLDSLGVCDDCADATTDVPVGVDAAADATQDAVSTADVAHPDAHAPDASDGGQAAPPTCFGDKCQLGEVCCLDSSGSSQCAKQCAQGSVELACSGPSDCTNSYCCLKLQAGKITSSSCQTQCGNVLCSPLYGNDAGCPISDDCVPGSAQLPSGYGICF